MSLVAARNLFKTYRRGAEEVHALQDVTLDLVAGEVVALLGPSGSGKSTLLNVLCGWEHPEAGTVTWQGRPDPDLVSRGWSEIGIIPQRLGLLEDLTVRENIELPFVLSRREVSSLDRSTRAGAVMEALDIAHLADKLPAETSLGEQQRVGVGRAIILAPTLVLADEPTGNQDHRREALILERFRVLASNGACCLIATHNPQVLPFCDRAVHMQDGAIVSEARLEPQSLWARGTSPTK